MVAKTKNTSIAFWIQCFAAQQLGCVDTCDTFEDVVVKKQDVLHVLCDTLFGSRSRVVLYFW